VISTTHSFDQYERPDRTFRELFCSINTESAMKIRILLSTLIFAIVAGTWAQDAPTLSVNVNVVTLLAAVHDRNGRIVDNLTPDDFVLEEDGKPQKIRYFSRESDLPLTIGLLVDTSRSQQGVLAEESRASNAFLNQVLREGKDLAFVAHFDTHVEVLQGLTSSHNELAAALGRLSIPDEFATLIYSAIRQCSDDVMRGQTGRKAFILLTDGVAFKDPTSMETAIELAQRADTMLYSIRYSDPITQSNQFIRRSKMRFGANTVLDILRRGRLQTESITGSD